MKFPKTLLGLLPVLLIVAGCATPPPAEPEVEPDLRVGNLLYAKDGFVDLRTGWIYPQTLVGGLAATQAWDLDRSLIGIAYTPGTPGPDLAISPMPLPDALVEWGTVSLVAYPVGYQATDRDSIPDAGNLPRVLGLGHGETDSLDEFYAYQDSLESGKFHLWKMVKLADTDAPSRTFHSQLFLKKIREEKTDALVVTIGQVEGIYTLIVIRKYVRTREEVDQFGDWAYGILRELGLTAVQE